MTSYIVFIRTEPRQDMFGELVNEIISFNFPRSCKVEVEYLVLDMIKIFGSTEAVFVLCGS